MTMDKVREFLESIGLYQYVKAFEDQGWDDIDVVKSMSKSDVKTCMKKPGHVKKFQLWLEKSRKKENLSGNLGTGSQVKVREFLESIGLGQYVQALVDQGWDDIDVVMSMSDTDIETCIPKKRGHVKKLLLWLEKARRKEKISWDLGAASQVKVLEFLESVGLGQYIQSLEDQGWDDIEVVMLMSKTDIRKCIQKPGHVKKMLLWLGKSRNKKSIVGDFKREDSATSVEDVPTTDDESSFIMDVVKNDATSETQDKASQYEVSLFSKEENYDDVSCESSIVSQTNTCHDVNVDCIDGKDQRAENHEQISTQDRRIIGVEEMSSIIAEVQETGMRAKIPNLVTVVDSKNVTVAENAYTIHKENVYGENFKDQILTYLKGIENKHKSLFVTTTAVEEVNFVLDDRYSVLILGNSGEGKSTISDHLLLQYKKKNYEPLIITSADDWKSLVIGGKNKKKQFVKIDDMFGISSVEERKLQEWKPLLKMMGEMIQCRKGNLRVVFTSRKLIFSNIGDNISSFKCFEKMRTIDLSDAPYALKEDEKVEMMKKYVSHYKIDLDEKVIRSVAGKTTHCFPGCVEKFCTTPSLYLKGVSFFDKPLRFLRDEISDLQMKDKVKFSALVLVLIAEIQKQEFILYDEIKNYSELLDVTKKLVNAPTISIEDIYQGIDCMINVYLDVKNYVCTFKHISVYETVSFVLAITNLVAVKYLDIDFIVNRTKLIGYKKAPDEDIVILPKNYIKYLVQRFTESISNHETKVFEYHAWGEQEFIQIWLDYVASNECEMCLDDIVQINFNGDNILSLLAAYSHEEAVMAILSNAQMNTQKWSKQLSTALFRAAEADCSCKLLQRIIRCLD